MKLQYKSNEIFTTAIHKLKTILKLFNVVKYPRQVTSLTLAEQLLLTLHFIYNCMFIKYFTAAFWHIKEARVARCISVWHQFCHSNHLSTFGTIFPFHYNCSIWHQWLNNLTGWNSIKIKLKHHQITTSIC